MDWLGGLDEALSHIEEFKLVQKAQKGASGQLVYGILKQEMWRETIQYLDQTSEADLRWSEWNFQAAKERERRERSVQDWEEKAKSKLWVFFSLWS